MDQIQIRTATENQRSEKIPRSLGFHLQTVLSEAQMILRKPQDLNVFTLERQTWEKGLVLRTQVQEAAELRKSGNAERALQLLMPLLEKFPSDPALNYQVAWTMDVLGQESRAVPHYQAALASGISGEDRVGALLGLGSTYRCLGAYEQSLKIFNQAIAEFPADRPLRVFRALTLSRLGHSEEAISVLLKELLDTTADKEILSYERALRGTIQHPPKETHL